MQKKKLNDGNKCILLGEMFSFKQLISIRLSRLTIKIETIKNHSNNCPYSFLFRHENIKYKKKKKKKKKTGHSINLKK